MDREPDFILESEMENVACCGVKIDSLVRSFSWILDLRSWMRAGGCGSASRTISVWGHSTKPHGHMSTWTLQRSMAQWTSHLPFLLNISFSMKSDRWRWKDQPKISLGDFWDFGGFAFMACIDRWEEKKELIFFTGLECMNSFVPECSLQGCLKTVHLWPPHPQHLLTHSSWSTIWMDGWIVDEWVDGWVGWIDGWMDGWISGWVGRWMDGAVGGWMDE